ncbi:hypothetical protein [Carnobacterium divergens]|nr:hypothetical protein [Carnobacterium divergens]
MWQIILAFVLGLCCRMTITIDRGHHAYKQGFNDAIESVIKLIEK